MNKRYRVLLVLMVCGFTITAQDTQWLLTFSGFGDAVKHWQNKHGKDYQRYKMDDFKAIADNLLLYQKDNGGWVENQDPLRVLSAKEQAEISHEKQNPTVSLDNRNLYSQVAYLYGVYAYTGQLQYQGAALKGLELILKLQHPSGGWPHTVPATKSYHNHLTLADEVTPGVLTMLQDIVWKQHPFTDIPEAYRLRAELAQKKGTDCLLKLQVRQGGLMAIWAGQYDSTSLAPAQGRSFELPSLATWESVAVVQYFQRIEKPSPEIRQAIASALQWFKEHEMKGYKIVEEPLKQTQQFEYHKADFERKLIKDHKAVGLWARFYDLKTNAVVMANRDGKRVQIYEELDLERRTGYQWYGDWPVVLFEAK
jgi:PelA/Pel-15E family pectate lyase